MKNTLWDLWNLSGAQLHKFEIIKHMIHLIILARKMYNSNINFMANILIL